MRIFCFRDTILKNKMPRKKQKNNRKKGGKDLIILHSRAFLDSYILDIVFAAFFIFALLLIFSLYKLQIVKGDEYNQQVLLQTQGTTKLERRGTIFFNNHEQKRAAVALQGIGYYLYTDPKYVENINTTYEQISKIVDIDKKEFLKKAGKEGSRYEIIAHKITEENALKIKSLGLSGVRVKKES